jgi:hypothetical protein
LHKQMLIQMKVVTQPKLNCWLAGIHQLMYRSPDLVFGNCLWVAIHNVHMSRTTCSVNVMTARKVFYFLIWQVFLLHCYYETITAVPCLRQLVAGPLLRTGFSLGADYVTCSGQSGSVTVFSLYILISPISVITSMLHTHNFNQYNLTKWQCHLINFLMDYQGSVCFGEYLMVSGQIKYMKINVIHLLHVFFGF